MEIGKWEAIHSNWGCYHPRQVEVVCFHGLFAGEKVSKSALSSTLASNWVLETTMPPSAGVSPHPWLHRVMPDFHQGFQGVSKTWGLGDDFLDIFR